MITFAAVFAAGFGISFWTDPTVIVALGTSRSSIGGTSVHFRSRLVQPLTLDLEARNQLHRIAQEAVQNALKHARARSVEIDLWAHTAGLTMTINDDGGVTVACNLAQPYMEPEVAENWFH